MVPNRLNAPKDHDSVIVSPVDVQEHNSRFQLYPAAGYYGTEYLKLAQGSCEWELAQDTVVLVLHQEFRVCNA